VPAVTLPIDHRSVSAARTLLHSMLRQRRADAALVTAARSDRVEDAVLMMSELVTNALRHTRATLRLEIDILGDILRVSVVDDAPDLPAVQPQGDHAVSGRGLRIVDTLADRWGSFPGPGSGKTVWFETTLR
jgi:signal transduction histidine kinase